MRSMRMRTSFSVVHCAGELHENVSRGDEFCARELVAIDAITLKAASPKTPRTRDDKARARFLCQP
jgi:hypothetical protein